MMHEKRYLPKGEIRNPTTRTGRIVHAEHPDRRTFPGCRYMYGIVYTAAPVNCPACLNRL